MTPAPRTVPTTSEIVDRGNYEIALNLGSAKYTGRAWGKRTKGRIRRSVQGTAARAAARGFMDLGAENTLERVPKKFEGPGFPWAFEFVYVLHGGEARFELAAFGL